MRKVILILSITIAIISTIGVLTNLSRYHQGQKAYKEVADAAIINDNTANFSVSVDFNELKNINKDIAAWIYSEDTPINYPVVQGEDNSKYLAQMYNLEWDGCGAIFIDYRCENPFKDFNTIIYGHRMKDNSMFGSFGKYRNQKYFDKHSKMIIITENREFKVDLFAVITVPRDSDLYKLDFKTKSEKEKYIEEITSLTDVISEVGVTPDDNIIMLSTCTYEYDDARLVLFGRVFT